MIDGAAASLPFWGFPLGVMASCRDFPIHTKPWENFSRLFRGHYLEKRWDIMLLLKSCWEYLKTGIPPTLKE
jgi:hypothetical protein